MSAFNFKPEKVPQQQQNQQPHNQQPQNQQSPIQQQQPTVQLANQQQSPPSAPPPSQETKLERKKSLTNLSSNVKTRYEFPDIWKFWLILVSSQQSSRQYQIEEIFSFRISDYFFHYYHALPKLSELKNVNNKNISLALFKDQIKPAWEDPKNQGGGYYSFTISLNDKGEEEKKDDDEKKADTNKELDDLKKPIDKIWFFMLLRIIGNSLQEEFKDRVSINGIYMKLKPNNNAYDMQIWVGPSLREPNTDTDFINNIVNFCKEYANYDFNIPRQGIMKPTFVSFQSKKK